MPFGAVALVSAKRRSPAVAARAVYMPVNCLPLGPGGCVVKLLPLSAGWQTNQLLLLLLLSSSGWLADWLAD